MTATHPTRVVYDSPRLQAVFRPGRTAWLLITFGPFGLRPDGKAFWGSGFAAKLDLTALGFVTRADDWYPAAEMRKARAALEPLLAAYPERMTYGGSMGGYAAIKHGALLGAERCIAYAPQYSIDPRDVRDADFNRYFDPTRHGAMAIAAADLPRKTFLLFDPHHPPDLAHSGAIGRLAPSVRLIAIPNVGHECVKVFAGTPRAGALIKACRGDDAAAAQALARRFRADSPLRIVGVAAKLARRSPAAALALFQRHEASFERKQIGNFYSALSREFLARNDLAHGEACAAKAIQMIPTRISFIRSMIATKQRQGDSEGAIAWCRRALEIDPGSAHERHTLAEIFHVQGRYAEAESELLKVHKIVPAEVAPMLLMARVKTEQAQHAEARDWLGRALSASPRDAQLHYTMGRVQLALKDVRAAMRSLATAARLAPANDVYRRESERVAAALATR